jgi:hypothetical protein
LFSSNDAYRSADDSMNPIFIPCFFSNGGPAMLDFSLFGRRSRPPTSRKALERALAVTWESLENRQLLSANPFPAHDNHHPDGPPDHGATDTIEFSQAPSAVQTGLDALATTDSVTAPIDTSTIHLANANGIETYTYDTAATGEDSRLTVDQNGVAITAPTHSTTTFGAITNTAVTNEINAIATALDLTAPISTTSVDVLTATDGSATYSISLAPATTTTTTTDDHYFDHNATISVDSNGNPVGHERVPLSVLSTVIQTGLTSNAPSGATALDSTSLVDVNSIEGTTLYTAHYSSTGTQTTVTVNAAGILTSLPSVVQSTFGDIPMAAQSELQALATADGFTGTIDATLSVTESVEVNGTIIYTIRLPITSDDSSSEDITLTLSVDALGNPTVPPGNGIGREGPPRDRQRDDNDDSDSNDNSSSNSGSSTTTTGCDPSTGSTSSSGTSDSSGSSSSSSSSTPALSVGSDGSSTAAGSTTIAAATTASTTTSSGTTTTVLTPAEQRAAVRASAKAARLAKVAARQAAALAAKIARQAAVAARKAARLAAQSAE